MARTSLLACALLAGCSFAPHYAPPKLAIPATYKESGPWTSATPADAAPRGDWWTSFNDPALNALEVQVATANASLAAALAAYDQSQAYADAASAAELPWLSFAGSDTGNRQSAQRPLRSKNQPNEYANNQAALGLSYEFDFWGRVRNLAAASQAKAEASAADVATAQLSLQAELADAYMSLRGLDAQSQLLATTVDDYQRALDLVQLRHNGGIASGLDFDRASSQLASAKAQVSDVAAARALYEHAIATLVGKPASDFTLAAKPDAASIPAVPASVPSTLLQRRPDIAAAERNVFAANAAIGAARAAFYPTITLLAGAGFENTGSVDLLTLPDSAWTLGPQVTLPIFDAGRLSAQLAAAHAIFDQASANYRASVLAAFEQVEDQLALANHLGDESVDRRQAMEFAQSTENLSLIRYREGIINYLDVVVAQTDALSAEQTYLALQTRRERAAVDLIRALGGGWNPQAPLHLAQNQ